MIPYSYLFEHKNIFVCDCQMSETLARTGLELHHAVRSEMSIYKSNNIRDVAAKNCHKTFANKICFKYRV